MWADGRIDRENIVRQTDMTKLLSLFANLRTCLQLLLYFSACCNYTYLTNLIKMRLQCSTKKKKALIKEFSLNLVNVISNNFLPSKANILRNCIRLMHSYEPWTKKYITPADSGRKRVTPLSSQRVGNYRG